MLLEIRLNDLLPSFIKYAVRNVAETLIKGNTSNFLIKSALRISKSLINGLWSRWSAALFHKGTGDTVYCRGLADELKGKTNQYKTGGGSTPRQFFKDGKPV